MDKKRAKKLELNREDIRNLVSEETSDAELEDVAGGRHPAEATGDSCMCMTPGGC